MMSALVKAILVSLGWIGWNLLNLLRILDLEGIVKKFRWFCAVTAFWVATSSNGKFYGMTYGKMQDLEVAVHIDNRCLQ